MIEVAESLRHPPRCDKTGLEKLDVLMAGEDARKCAKLMLRVTYLLPMARMG